MCGVIFLYYTRSCTKSFDAVNFARFLLEMVAMIECDVHHLQLGRFQVEMWQSQLIRRINVHFLM